MKMFLIFLLKISGVKECKIFSDFFSIKGSVFVSYAD